MCGQNLNWKFCKLFSTIAVFWVVAIAVQGQERNMTNEIPEKMYSGINIDAENMFLKVYINGALMLLHGRFDPMRFTFGINRYLRSGENIIVVDYEPFDMEKQAFTPHEGVALQVKIDRHSQQQIRMDDEGNISVAPPDLTEEVHLFSGRYDIKTGQMQQTKESAFNEGPLVRQNGGLAVIGTFKTEPITMVYSNRTSDGFARRLTFTFDINDASIPTPPWVNAPPLTDTPELRAELWQAYQLMHRIIATRDVKAYREAMKVFFTHEARGMGYRDVDQFMDELFEKRPFQDTPDEHVAPLLPATTAINGDLDFGTSQRMVRFFPDPIQYVTETGEPSGSHSFFYCRQPDGHLAVCYVDDVPYQ